MNIRHAAAKALPTWQGFRLAVGLTIVALGSLLLVNDLVAAISEGDARIHDAWWGGLMAAVATGLGTIPVMLSQRVSQRASDTMLGFGAGVMLAATAFSLIVPALAAARGAGHGQWAAGGIIAAGIMLGALFLLAADHALPTGHVPTENAAAARALRRAWVFVAAISLHNFPEGLAIGVGFAGSDPAHARALATGISIQDVPEGLVVALALRSVGYGRPLAVALGIASGLIEPVASVAGAAAIAVSAGLLPWGLAFAAGAMLYAISHEAIPGSHMQGNASHATVGLVVGFVLMMLLDTVLGAPSP